MINHQALRRIEVLLVENSPSDANLTIKGFLNAQIANNLHWVEDGESAMNYLQEQEEFTNAPHPDLILLDLNLPGMDGREVLTEIKSDPNLKCIPVVIITTSSDEQDILHSYNISANCYVTKPIDIYQFIQVVQLSKDFWLIAVTSPGE
ncbi:MAG: response regulator [Nostoc sp. JL34]|uniref:response regulator n=1 Tax=Nostoc sp. JL34 TaxID=2815397 RepID=UPI001D81E269|nr:response regulator [Nostoc sp. JL34]MBN3886720.1 response regulator [Nostoc sp. JL34]